MTGTDVVRKVFPKATKEEVKDLLWSRTAYPFSTDPKRLLSDLGTYKKTIDAGKEPCDFCNKPAPSDHLCPRCKRDWNRLRRQQDKEERLECLRATALRQSARLGRESGSGSPRRATRRPEGFSECMEGSFEFEGAAEGTKELLKAGFLPLPKCDCEDCKRWGRCK
jgi:hypothetical protein